MKIMKYFSVQLDTSPAKFMYYHHIQFIEVFGDIAALGLNLYTIIVINITYYLILFYWSFAFFQILSYILISRSSFKIIKMFDWLGFYF